MDAHGRSRMANDVKAIDHGANIALTVTKTRERTAVDRPFPSMIGCVIH